MKCSHYFVLVEPYEKSQNVIYQCLMSIYWKLTKLIICLAQYLAYLINDLNYCVPKNTSVICKEDRKQLFRCIW